MSNFFGTLRNTPTMSFDVPVYEGHVEPTADAIMAITTEGVLEGLQLQAALYVADATVAYTTVHESAGAAEAVLENVIASTFGKLKDGLLKLWAKIKAWFKSVFKSFSLMFSKGKDFIKKYKKEIEQKTSDGFEYEGFVWTIDKGNAKSSDLVKTIGAKLYETLKEDHLDKDNQYDLSEIKEDLVKRLGNTLGANIDDVSEIKEELQKAYRNNSDEKEEIKDFSKISKGTLIDIIEKNDKHQKVITDIEKEINNHFKKTIEYLNKWSTEISKRKDDSFAGNTDEEKASNRTRATALATIKTNVTRYAQSLNTTIAAAAVENIKNAATEAESVLKRFIKFKGVKESFGSDPTNGGDTVIESLMNSIRL